MNTMQASCQCYSSSGIRQGDPLSPALFSLLTTFLVYDMQRLRIKLFILLYADDIILGFTGKGAGAIFDAKTAMYALSIFGYFSGLKVNPAKSFVLYKPTLLDTPTSVAGLEVKKKTEVLGYLDWPHHSR